jgi:hypothetical protein
MNIHDYRNGFRIVTLLALAGVGSNAYTDERGSVTAVASVGAKNAAFIGFSTGAVLYCNRIGGCTQLEGTPQSAVTAIDTPRRGDSTRAWVGYENGSIYFCTLTGQCTLQEQ